MLQVDQDGVGRQHGVAHRRPLGGEAAGCCDQTEVSDKDVPVDPEESQKAVAPADLGPVPGTAHAADREIDDRQPQKRAGDLGNDSRGGDALDAPPELQDEDEVEHDIHAVDRDLGCHGGPGPLQPQQPADDPILDQSGGRAPDPDIVIGLRVGRHLRAGIDQGKGER